MLDDRSAAEAVNNIGKETFGAGPLNLVRFLKVTQQRRPWINYMAMIIWTPFIFDDLSGLQRVPSPIDTDRMPWRLHYFSVMSSTPCSLPL